MNIHDLLPSRRAIVAAVTLIGAGLAGPSALASGIKSVGNVVYDQAPPGLYSTAPSAYGQAPYYLVSKHHRQYIVPGAALGLPAYAPTAYTPTAYAPVTYAPNAYAPAYAPSAYAPYASAPAPSSNYYYPTPATTAAAPAPAPTQTAAAPPPPVVATSPEDGTEATESTTPAEFKLTGAVLQTYMDDLRKFYAGSAEAQGMAKIKALKDEAKTIYTTYDEAAGEIAPNSPIDKKIDELVAKVVKQDRDRLTKSSHKGRGGWQYTAWGWQYVPTPTGDDGDDDDRNAGPGYGYGAAPGGPTFIQVMAPAPAPYVQAPAPQQYYYVPGGHRSKYSIR